MQHITNFTITEHDTGWAFHTNYDDGAMLYQGGGFGSALDAAHAALTGMGNIDALPIAVEWLADSIEPHGDPGGLLALAMLLRYAELHVAADYRARLTEHFTTRDRGIPAEFKHGATKPEEV